MLRRAFFGASVTVDVGHGRPEDDLLREGQVGLCTDGGYVVQQGGPPEAGGLGQAYVPGNHSLEEATFEVIAIALK